MVSHNSDRFVGLSDTLADELKCGICLNILDNAVDTNCRHTFCCKCINECIQSNNRKECPQCRQSVANRSRAANDVIYTDFIFISRDILVIKNRRLNDIISKLNIKCDYEWNGCPVVVALEWLDTHLKTCGFWMCRTCDLSIAGQLPEEHNCMEQMKKERLDLMDKLKISDNNYKSIKSENEFLNNKTQELYIKCKQYKEVFDKLDGLSPEIRKQLPNINSNDIVGRIVGYQQNRSTFQFTDCVMFGTYITAYKSVDVTTDGLKLFNITPNNGNPKFKYHIMVPYVEMVSSVYYSANSYLFICIKPIQESCHKIQMCLYLGNNSTNGLKFDINSNDPNEQMIVIVMRDTNADQLIQTMTDNFKIINEDCECLPMDPISGQQMLTRLGSCIQNSPTF